MSNLRQIRCSQLPQMLKCPASWKVRQVIKSNRDTGAAMLGTWIHYQVAKRLVGHGAYADDGALVEPTMKAGWKPASLHEWMVRFCTDAALTYTDGDMALDVEAVLGRTFSRFVLSGHIDAYGVSADETEIAGMDYKTGTEHVDEAKDNAQVLGYMVLLALQFPKAQKISFAIAQPLNNEEEGFEKISSVTLVGDEIPRAVAYLEAEINSAIDRENELNSDGWKQCRYCPAAIGGCPAIDADLANMKMILTPEHLAAIKAEPSIERLLSIDIERRKLEPMFEASKEALKERIERDGPQTIQGVKVWLEDRNGRRTISDNAQATEILRELPDTLFHETYAFKADPIERAYAKHFKIPHDSKKGACGKSVFKSKLGHLVEQDVTKVLKIAEVA
jgi:hypothetical protein